MVFAQASWADVPWGALVAVALALWTLGLLAMDERNRKKFAAKSDVCTPDGKSKFPTREEMTGLSQRLDRDLDGIGRKVDMNTGLYSGLDDRLGHLEAKAAQMEERQTQQWSRVSEQMAHTAEALKDVVAEVKEVSAMQHELALRMERLHRNGGEK